ncbi:MAG: TolC family protein [Fibromonadaceae bacterium]|jgi:outer membrane protein TolC|nr:TolC family protein [Fibromonadaceae bacterium]
MNKLIIGILFLSVAAQSSYESVLQQIETNNTTLAALRQQTDAHKIGNRTGLLPDNPEVEFSHLWGIENRMDFSVTQTFDFPTVYKHRSRIAALQNEGAEQSYKAQRIEVLLLAKQTCIELVYYNILAKEYDMRLKNAQLVANAYKTKLDKGETNILEYNKAQLNLTSVQVEAAQIETQRTDLLAQLKRLNGGKEITFLAESYPANTLPSNFEEWYATAESKNPELQFVRKQIEIDMQQIKLSRAMGLPKFSAGYTSEISGDESSHGIAVGLSIPLWENKNRVSEARAQARAAESALKDSQVQFYNRLQSQYLKAVSLQQNALKFRQSLTENGNESLLKKALDAGEISLLDYLREIEYYYDTMNKVLEMERDFEIAAAEFLGIPR